MEVPASGKISELLFISFPRHRLIIRESKIPLTALHKSSRTTRMYLARGLRFLQPSGQGPRLRSRSTAAVHTAILDASKPPNNHLRYWKCCVSHQTTPTRRHQRHHSLRGLETSTSMRCLLFSLHHYPLPIHSDDGHDGVHYCPALPRAASQATAIWPRIFVLNPLLPFDIAAAGQLSPARVPIQPGLFPSSFITLFGNAGMLCEIFFSSEICVSLRLMLL
jgi:hypothetical protein